LRADRHRGKGAAGTAPISQQAETGLGVQQGG
jgi:hypothetical protein